jgi:DNA repair protein RadB
MRFLTGLPGLDEKLGGGIASRTLTLVYGEEKSGKTSLVLMICALATRQLPAAYIDCSGRLHSARISQIMRALGGDEEKLYILSIESFQDQEKVILSLHDLMPPARLLVFDDFTALHRLELSGDIRLDMPVYRRLAFQVAALKEAALRNDLAIVIVGHVHDMPDRGESRAVAQRILGYWSDMILRLGLDLKTRVGRVIIEKPERVEAAAYRITGSGLTQAQPP